VREVQFGAVACQFDLTISHHFAGCTNRSAIAGAAKRNADLQAHTLRRRTSAYNRSSPKWGYVATAKPTDTASTNFLMRLLPVLQHPSDDVGLFRRIAPKYKKRAEI
jgi:hypothetical protein